MDKANEPTEFKEDTNGKYYEFDKQFLQLRKAGSHWEFLKDWIWGTPASVSAPFVTEDFTPCDKESELDILNQMKIRFEGVDGIRLKKEKFATTRELKACLAQ